jgi:hypothetical protein
VATLLLVVVLLQDWLVTVGPDTLQMADEALIVAAVLGATVRVGMSGRFVRTPLDLPTLGFLAVGGLAAVFRDVPPVVAALGLLSLAKGLLAFQVFARLPVRRPSADRAVFALLAIGAGLAAIGVFQWLGGAPAYHWTGRWAYYLTWEGGKAPSLMLNHNALGHLCVFGGLMAIGLALSYRARASRRMLAAATVFFLGLVVSASRESWLAMAVALPAGAAVTGSRRLWRTAAVTTVALAAGAVLVYFSSPFLREEIARRGAGVLDGWRSYAMGYRDWAYRGEYRVYVILKSLEVLRDHLWIGTGPGRFGGQVALVYESPLYEQYRFLPLRGAYHPLDVFWSRLLAEFGLLGSACYAAAVVAAARIHFRARQASDALLRGLAVGGWMSVVAIVVIGLFAPALEDPLTAVPFWAWAGFTWALWRARAES